MKLSHDCIRDILLFSESLPYNEPAFGDKIFKSDLLKKYSSEEINYAVSKLGDDDAQLIKGYVKFASNKPYMTYISSLTFDGHKYLDNIRDPKIWKESKKISSKLASVSIDIMSEIAAKVVTKTLGLD
ncbi:hypothetical protein Q9Q_01568 [Enterococcus faecalis EnGen0078]|uniref:DUF2513 domain-containing protein n=1 Tax=Enterococcus faecalis TaxID=1351 RepID=UPI00032E4055|nr:DUF2513 domain-containing protein [Enterococcus faecalis]EGO2515536.1 DUF2513 domain-containing protein [Enterococcus faecalis]EOE08503.1 hypothetical protein Q9Q_01568 [Enterococcus faecalis EnGen0078]EOK28340.1 hypothetical protein WU9_02405 [Enterococcus faecalis EnGen0334]EOL17984.1 hypothetical protein WU3_02447 [Enterococcus faecalis EnGen0331]HAP5954274.1 DUF2513 domain-containing protein [Enterococcus faecalis]